MYFVKTLYGGFIMYENEEKSGKIEEAVKYASGSNCLENHILSDEELGKIIEDIKTGKTDESFLWAVAEAVKKKQEEKKVKLAEDVNCGKIRK